MPYEKGHKKIGGRKKGSENKTTKDIREAYRQLIENNLDNMTSWLKTIASKNPEKAIYILSDLSEYVLPKLQRTEHVGKDGNDLFPVINVMPNGD